MLHSKSLKCPKLVILALRIFIQFLYNLYIEIV